METRCPHCKTVFELQPQDLARANGRVRCGECTIIFDATENLLEGDGSAAPELAARPANWHLVAPEPGETDDRQSGQAADEPIEASDWPAPPAAEPFGDPTSRAVDAGDEFGDMDAGPGQTGDDHGAEPTQSGAARDGGDGAGSHDDGQQPGDTAAPADATAEPRLPDTAASHAEIGMTDTADAAAGSDETGVADAADAAANVDETGVSGTAAAGFDEPGNREACGGQADAADRIAGGRQRDEDGDLAADAATDEYDIDTAFAEPSTAESASPGSDAGDTTPDPGDGGDDKDQMRFDDDTPLDVLEARLAELAGDTGIAAADDPEPRASAGDELDPQDDGAAGIDGTSVVTGGADSEAADPAASDEDWEDLLAELTDIGDAASVDFVVTEQQDQTGVDFTLSDGGDDAPLDFELSGADAGTAAERLDFQLGEPDQTGSEQVDFDLSLVDDDGETDAVQPAAGSGAADDIDATDEEGPDRGNLVLEQGSITLSDDTDSRADGTRTESPLTFDETWLSALDPASDDDAGETPGSEQAAAGRSAVASADDEIDAALMAELAAAVSEAEPAAPLSDLVGTDANDSDEADERIAGDGEFEPGTAAETGDEGQLAASVGEPPPAASETGTEPAADEVQFAASDSDVPPASGEPEPRPATLAGDAGSAQADGADPDERPADGDADDGEGGTPADEESAGLAPLDAVVAARPARRGLWFSLSVLLALALGAQVVHSKRNVLATDDRLRPVLDAVYSRLDMPLVPEWEVGNVCIEVSQFTATNESLDVLSRLANVGDRPQPLPVLRLTAADRAGNLEASHFAKPADYLAEANRGMERLAPGGTAAVSLSVDYPGDNAMRAELAVCYPDAGGALRCGTRCNRGRDE